MATSPEFAHNITQAVEALDRVAACYKTMASDEDIPDVCHEIGSRMSLIKTVLKATQESVNPGISTEGSIVENGRRAAQNLRTIFTAMSTEGQRSDQYRDAVRGLRKGNKAEELMTRVLMMAKALARHLYGSGNSTLTNIDKSLQAIKEVGESVGDDIFDNSGVSIFNSGSGPQNVNTGHGTQNNNTGDGRQYIAQSQTFNG